MMTGEILEAAMLICFGLSWPLNAYKNFRAATAVGTSWQFILLITCGYLAGIAAKYVSGQLTWVLVVYFLNLFCLALNWLVYFRNVKLDKERLSAVKKTKGDIEGPALRVLIATDGSKAASKAVSFVNRSLDLEDARVDVVSVIDSGTEDAQALAKQNVFDALALLNAPEAKRSGTVREGSPAGQIVEAAREFDSDLIVMGNRGLSGLESMLLGSVSRAVMERADKPVLVVK